MATKPSSLVEPKLPEGVQDPYGLLEVAVTATHKEIRRAYRKKALDDHPDKNPDDPDAQKRFHVLHEVYKFLSHKEARAHFDSQLRAAEEIKTRHAQRDSRRKGFAEDLERREAEWLAREKKEGQTRAVGKDTTVLTEERRRQNAMREETDAFITRVKEETRREIKMQSKVASGGPSGSPTHRRWEAAAYLSVTWKRVTEENVRRSASHQMPEKGINDDADCLPPFHGVVTEPTVLLALQSFGVPRIMRWDKAACEALVALPSREAALNATLFFLRNKKKYPFTVKCLKHPPPLEATFEPGLERPSGGVSFTHQKANPEEPTQSSGFEVSVLSKLREAAKRRKLTGKASEPSCP